MIENLYKKQAYPVEMQRQIEQMGATAITIANRWMLGWESKVETMLVDITYLNHLINQTELEKTVLSEEPNSSHLSRWEILQKHEVRAYPPI